MPDPEVPTPRAPRSPAEEERDRLLQVALEERIREALPDERGVRVTVMRGVVSLRGEVDSPADARRVKAVCREVQKVELLQDYLRPRRLAPGR